VIHHHYHQTPGSERTVSALLSNIGSDAARNVGSDLLAGAVVADSAVVGKILADRKEEEKTIGSATSRIPRWRSSLLQRQKPLLLWVAEL
jgi:hypothetical protein